jgi:hypothetical protein
MMTQDEEHLRLLSIFHYIVGGLAALFALFPAIYLVLGLVFILAPQKLASPQQSPPEFLGWIFIVMGSVAIIFGLLFSALIIAAGRFLARLKHRMFCIVIAGVETIFMPFGTVLGIFTIIVLMRESVKQLFEGGDPQ